MRKEHLLERLEPRSAFNSANGEVRFEGALLGFKTQRNQRLFDPPCEVGKRSDLPAKPDPDYSGRFEPRESPAS